MKFTIINNRSSPIKIDYSLDSNNLILKYNGVNIFSDHSDNSGSIARFFSLNKELIIDKEINQLRKIL